MWPHKSKNTEHNRCFPQGLTRWNSWEYNHTCEETGELTSSHGRLLSCVVCATRWALCNTVLKKSEVKMGVKRHCMKINLNYCNLTKIQFIWDYSSLYVTEKSEKMSLLLGWSYLWLSRNIQNLKNIPFESKIKFVKVSWWCHESSTCIMATIFLQFVQLEVKSVAYLP